MFFWWVFVAAGVFVLLLITFYVRATRKRRAEAQSEKLAEQATMQVAEQATMQVAEQATMQVAEQATVQVAHIHYPRGTGPPPGSPMLKDYADQLRSYPRSYRKQDRELGPKYYRSKVNGKRVWITPQLRSPPKR